MTASILDQSGLRVSNDFGSILMIDLQQRHRLFGSF
jgi:hypothetical protein